MESNFNIVFSGYFGEKGIYFQGDIISGTLYFDNPQHTNITGKSDSIVSELRVLKEIILEISTESGLFYLGCDESTCHLRIP